MGWGKSEDEVKIVFWNRKKSQEETEHVYGDEVLQWVYGTPVGRFLAEHILSRSFLSQIYGAYQSSRLSRHKVPLFISQFKIAMDEFEEGPFHTFNDFFIRKFKPSIRKFAENPANLAAFAEARYLAFEKIQSTQKFPVKGQFLSATALLGSAEKAKPFQGGPLLLARLCPTDYHRFHFPDSGRVLEAYSLNGKLHSVNPVAIAQREDVFVTNERRVSLLDTEHFGKLAYIEVGALCVGRIIQSHLNPIRFKRGEEKGYFLFGGSTVIVLGEPGRWRPDADLLEQTALGRETFVQLGDSLATRSQ